MDRERIEAALTLDPYSLDKHWVEHPANVLYFTTAAVDAERVLAQLKLKKDILVANLDAELRNNSSERVTEAVLRNYVVRQDSYQEIEDEIIEAEYEVNMLKAAVRSLEHMRKGLEKLVDLHMINWFSEPRSPIGADLVQEQVHEKLRKSLGGKQS